jgi:hypothetical protein
MATVNKEISDSTELLEFEHNTIIDCKVKLQNIFTKELPESQIGIYGDYDILIFYRHDSRKKSKYETRIIRKTFNEIVSSSDVLQEGSPVVEKEIEIQEALFNPTCEFKMKNKHHNDTSYEIKVSGNISITYFSKKVGIAVVSQIQDVQIIDKNIILPELKEEVFQLHGNNQHSIEELMKMDLESLKKISKDND